MGNKFKWTVTTNKCSSSDEVVIYNNKPKSEGIQQPTGESVICDNSVSLVANSYTPETLENVRTVTSEWLVNKSKEGIANPAALNTTASTLKNGVNKLNGLLPM
jgi:hypothetical protein